MKTLFFHGGPGLNSNPEKHLLTKSFHKAGHSLECWNEPSALRPEGPVYKADNAFQNYLDSAEAFLLQHYNDHPLHVIGHSFGAQVLCYLAVRHPEKLQHLFFVCSDLSIADTDLHTFRFIIDDYRREQDERAIQLERILENYSGNFDENTQNGFALAAQNPRYFSYCWHNKEQMAQYLPYYTAPKYVLDVEAYFAVRKSWYDIPLKTCHIPVTGIYGKQDIVIANDKELAALQQRFTNVQYYELEASAHNPHIEETVNFMNIFRNAAS